MRRIVFEIDGKPTAKGRPRAVSIGGHARVYTPKRTANYEAFVALAGAAALDGGHPFSVPVRVRIMWVLSIPASWPKWKREAASDGLVAPTVRPDIDNVQKSILDGLNQSVLADDSLIIGLHTIRKYGEKDTVIVEIEEAAMMTAQNKIKC